MSIELQNIDCNCNNCKYLERDFDMFAYWENWNREIQLVEFERKKEANIESAKSQYANALTESEKKGALRLLDKYKKEPFQFDKSSLLHYGKCSKLNKEISFIPNVCQIHTQKCFENRRQL